MLVRIPMPSVLLPRPRQFAIIVGVRMPQDAPAQTLLINSNARRRRGQSPVRTQGTIEPQPYLRSNPPPRPRSEPQSPSDHHGRLILAARGPVRGGAHESVRKSILDLRPVDARIEVEVLVEGIIDR